jgi:hypothetical protein
LQLSAKEDTIPAQPGLFSLPSMQFMESLLDEMDTRAASTGSKPAEPPLYLPLDSFDLPGFDTHISKPDDLLVLGLDAPNAPDHHRIPAASAPAGLSGSALGHPENHISQHHVSYIPMAPEAASAAPSPIKGASLHNRPLAPARRSIPSASDAEEELYGFDDAKASMQMSKSGRMRKVINFTGAKRKVSDMLSQGSAPAVLATGPTGPMQPQGVARAESMMTTDNIFDNDEINQRCKSGECNM